MRSSKPASGKLPFFRTLSRAFLLQIPKLYLFCQHYLAQHLLHCSCPKRPLVHYTTKKGENKNSQIGISIIEPGKMVIEANRRKLHFPVYAFIFNFSVFSRFPGGKCETYNNTAKQNGPYSKTCYLDIPKPEQKELKTRTRWKKHIPKGFYLFRFIIIL